MESKDINVKNNIIDARGQLCPMPLVLLIKALKETDDHIGLCIMTDNEISRNNLLSYLRDNEYIADCVQKDSFWSICIREKGGGSILSCSKASPSTSFVRNGQAQNEIFHNIHKINSRHILVVNRDKMGSGSDELGEILIKGFFNALNEMEILPEKIIFYNSGVLLCKKSYSEIESLKSLSLKGIDFIICGACVDYFQIKEDIAVGRISNMFAICEILQKCEKVMYL